eukprot:jgi/Tetstr1/433789/TSEL_002415.t1
MNLGADLFSLSDPRAHKYAKPLPKAASWKMADELLVAVLSSSPAGSAGLAGDGAASCITMVRWVGTGRQQIDAMRGVQAAVALFEFSTRKPPLAAICLPHVIRSIRHYQLMRRVASRAWPQELNNLNLDLEEQRQGERVFRDTYRK